MALQNKNQRSGAERGEKRNEYCNGGGEYDKEGKISNMCLRKYNAANCGVMWKSKNKAGRKKVTWGIKSKKRGY